jgi:hypothetical protein
VHYSLISVYKYTRNLSPSYSSFKHRPHPKPAYLELPSTLPSHLFIHPKIAQTQEGKDAVAAHNAGTRGYLPSPFPTFPFASSPTIPSPPYRPGLVWDAYLAADALKRARHLAETGPFQHEGMRREGEKLFMQIDGAHVPLTKVSMGG